MIKYRKLIRYTSTYIVRGLFGSDIGRRATRIKINENEVILTSENVKIGYL